MKVFLALFLVLAISSQTVKGQGGGFFGWLIDATVPFRPEIHWKIIDDQKHFHCAGSSVGGSKMRLKMGEGSPRGEGSRDLGADFDFPSAVCFTMLCDS